MLEEFEDLDRRIGKLESVVDKLREEMQGTLNEVVDELRQRNIALEATVEAMRAELDELKSELAAMRAVTTFGPWARQELKQRGVEDLSQAIAVAESLIEFERAEPSKRWSDHVEEESVSSSSSRRSSSNEEDLDDEQPRWNRKDEVEGRAKGRARRPLRCYVCEGPHKAAVCPQRKEQKRLAAMRRGESNESTDEEEPRREVFRLVSIALREGPRAASIDEGWSRQDEARATRVRTRKSQDARSFG